MVVFSELLSLCGIGVAFILVIYLIRKKLNFGLSLIIGSLVIGLFSLPKVSLVTLLKAFIKASIYSVDSGQFNTETLELALLMTLIYMLAKLMQETGAIRQLIDSLRTFFSKGGILAIIPSVYGLMPVPGGALFSAPMIDEEGDKFHIDKNQKNMLNIWFRHIWFPIYPISSAMILICSVDFSNIEIYTLALANMVSFITSICIGFILLRHYLGNNIAQPPRVTRDYNGFIYLLPPILPLLFYLPLQFFGVPQVRTFIIGVACSIILLFFLSKMNVQHYSKLLKKALTMKLALAIFGIMIFRELFEVSNASQIMLNILNSLAIPTLLMIIIIPLLLGVVTGYNLGAIALSYFLVQPFFEFSHINIIGLTSIIFMSAFVGYLISPIHLCNVVSSDYLNTDTTRNYRTFIPAAACLLFVQVVFIFIFFRV